MNVSFYFDPSCPWTWVTSRWLALVAGERDVNVTWRPFSLALNNGAMEGRDKTPHAEAHRALNNGAMEGRDKTPHAEAHRAAHRVLRVIAAASAQGAATGDLYRSFGLQRHVAGREYDDELILQVLKEHKLPLELAKAADDAGYDDELAKLVEAGTQAAGDDVGSPIITFDDKTGGKSGYFGPVITQLPAEQEALDLWDGLSRLAGSSSFYELKRSRSAGGPDTASTAQC